MSCKPLTYKYPCNACTHDRKVNPNVSLPLFSNGEVKVKVIFEDAEVDVVHRQTRLNIQPYISHNHRNRLRDTNWTSAKSASLSCFSHQGAAGLSSGRYFHFPADKV